MATVKVPNASAEWIRTLLGELERRQKVYKVYDDYFSGRQGERFVATGYRELFTQAFQNYCENICKVVVQTVEERLDVDGFRFPAAAGDDASATDPDAWRVWQDNALDARSQVAHTESMVNGVVYALVSPFTNDRIGPGKRSPRITIEKPSQTLVATDNAGIERLVGLKVWYDAVAKRRYLNLYFPDRIEKFQSGGMAWANQYGSGFNEYGGWEARQVPGETWPLRHGLGVVPLVPLVNGPRLGEGLWAGIEGDSDLVDIVPIQDGINFLALNGIVASDKAAFPQKWATGIELPRGEDGKVSAEWKPDIDDILSTRAPDAKFGNFEVAELQQYDGMLREKLGLVALISRIPIANFLPQTGQPASGEAREAAEIGLTKKAERKQRHLGEGWEEVMRLSFRQLGDEQRANDTACEAAWRPTSIMPSSAKIDSLVKERSLGVPLEVLWERAGHSATARAKFRKMIEGERTWLNATPVATTQPDALPAPGATPPQPAAKPASVKKTVTRDARGQVSAITEDRTDG